MHNNLKRVKGILSARLGTLVPKFQKSGQIFKSRYGDYGDLYTSDGIDWYEDELFSISRDNLSNLEINELNRTKLPVNLSPILFGNPAEGNPLAMLENTHQAKGLNLSNTSDLALLKTDPIGGGEIDVSSGMQMVEQKRKEYDNAKAEAKAQKLGNAAHITSQAILGLGNIFGALQSASDSTLTKGIDSGVDLIGGTLSSIGGVAGAVGLGLLLVSAAGQIIGGITGGTDLMTDTDKFFDSGVGTILGGWINQLWGQNSNSFGIDLSIALNVGSSYGGSMYLLNDAASKANKKYGLFSSNARKKANEDIALAKQTLSMMGNISKTATDQRLAVQSMGEQAGLAYSMMTDGGYNLKYTYAAKHGGLLEWNPVIELEWEPQVELNWELPTFKDGGSVEFVEELEWIPEFKDGGKTEESDVPETEETTQKNVIPAGALHKNKHHMEHAEGLTKKGIPVVDDDGEQQAEIEHSEIIFTLEVTKKLEEYYEIFYSEESTNKEKEQAALDAGKLLVYQILENTEDRTGLIESCKKGGTLTLKKSTDDLIEEVLEWMPTIVVVETEELEEKKEDKSEAKKEQSEKDKMKEAIKEVLIELLVK